MARIKKLTILIVILMTFISSPVFATQVNFGDSVINWPTWTGHSSYGYDDNILDVIGSPNISGGAADIGTGGYLKSVNFNYTVIGGDWDRLIPGNLFINLLDSDTTDHMWDYVVNTMGANYASTLSAGPYGLYNITALDIDDLKNGVNDDKYILSGSDVSGIWSGYVIRDNHPIGIKADYLTNMSGNVLYSGWPNKVSGNPNAGQSIYDFSLLNNGGLDLQNKDFIIGWGPTCANDVIYERISNIAHEDPGQPVPEPNTLALICCGLIGLAGIRRKF